MKKLFLLIITSFLLLFCGSTVSATQLDLDQGSLYTGGGGLGTGRGILFHADDAFTLNSVSIFGDLTVSSYDVDIYASSGPGNKGALLHSATASLGGSGWGYNKIDINYMFSAANHYIINWTRTDNAWMNNDLMYFNDSSLPIDYGVLTLLDGIEGYNATSFGNTVHAKFSLGINGGNPVPEPTTMLLFGLGLLGLAGVNRKE